MICGEVIGLTILLAGLFYTCNGAMELTEAFNRLSWEDAKTKCEEIGGILPILETEQERKEFEDLATSKLMFFGWLGLHIESEIKYSYEWVNGKELEEGELDHLVNTKKVRKSKSMCIAFRNERGRHFSFGIVPCNIRLPVICQVGEYVLEAKIQTTTATISDVTPEVENEKLVEEAQVTNPTQQEENEEIAKEAKIGEAIQQIAEEANIGKETQQVAEEAKIGEATQQVAEEAKIGEATQQVAEEAKIGEATQQVAEEAKIGKETQQVAEEAKIGKATQQVAEEAKISEATQQVAEEAKIGEATQQVAEEAKFGEATQTEEAKIGEATQQVVEEAKIGAATKQVAEEAKIGEATQQVEEENLGSEAIVKKAAPNAGSEAKNTEGEE